MTQAVPVASQQGSLLDEILEEAGIDEEEFLNLPGRITKMSWEGAKPWETGASVPGNDGLAVFAIYASGSEEERIQHVEYITGDIRVYAVPKQNTPGDTFRRLTINRASPAVTHESLTRESFITEVAREIQELEALEDAKVGETCDDCESLARPDDVFCAQCGARLPEDGGEDAEGNEVEGDEVAATAAETGIVVQPSSTP